MMFSQPDRIEPGLLDKVDLAEHLGVEMLGLLGADQMDKLLKAHT